ncbi:MAG: hypothetical protein ACWA5A_19130 [Marinibacterium sp.]
MLALSPASAIARDRLAATLWPDRAEDQARASLRQELSSLRRMLAPQQGIITAESACVRIDRACLSSEFGAPGDGEFLEGLELKSEPFDDWRRDQAARLASELPAAGVADGAADGAPDIFRNPPVLVMGFVPSSTSEEDGTFATGLVIDLRNSLALWRRFPVIGPEAIGWKSDRDCDLRETASSVRAAYAISGTVAGPGCVSGLRSA